MSRTESPPRSRSRRRLAAWLAFGAVGLATGAVWATGFAVVGSGGTNIGAVAPLLGATGPTDQVDKLATVTVGTALSIDWAGQQGTILAGTNFFTVDLSARSDGERFNIAFLLTNNALNFSNVGWASLQLEVEEVEVVALGTCAAATFDGLHAPKTMRLDAEDAAVYWNDLHGNKVYCIGIAASDGQDGGGTLIRRASLTSGPSVYPNFMATVDRAPDA